MKSLLVLLSVAAFALAKPSALLSGGVISAPLVAVSPAAVSRQSRVDIRSSPPVVLSAPVAPLVAQPALLKAPVLAPAALSTVSRIDINEAPALTTTLVSAVPLSYGTVGTLGYNTLLPTKLGLGYGAPVLANPLGTTVVNNVITDGLPVSLV